MANSNLYFDLITVDNETAQLTLVYAIQYIRNAQRKTYGLYPFFNETLKALEKSKTATAIAETLYSHYNDGQAYGIRALYSQYASLIRYWKYMNG